MEIATFVNAFCESMVTACVPRQTYPSHMAAPVLRFVHLHTKVFTYPNPIMRARPARAAYSHPKVITAIGVTLP